MVAQTMFLLLICRHYMNAHKKRTAEAGILMTGQRYAEKHTPLYKCFPTNHELTRVHTNVENMAVRGSVRACVLVFTDQSEGRVSHHTK